MHPESTNGRKNLLLICHSYNDFQKDPTEINAPHFSRVHVLVRTNILADLAQNLHLPIPQLVCFSSRYKIDTRGTPANTAVHLTPVMYVPTDHGYKTLGEKHLAAVETLIRKQGMVFDLIHAHFTWSAGYVGARLREKYKVPLVVTAHGEDIYALPFKDAVWKKNIEYVLNTADAVITVSRNNLACIRKLDVTTPVHVIPNGFKEDLFCPKETAECRSMLGLPQDRRILLTVGQYEAVKGQKYLVEAVGRIIQEKKDILCILIGFGTEMQSLEKQIRSLGLEDHILVAGPKPHTEIPLWMNACDLFVLPSLNEGNPTVLFEAIGCGKPFIGTRVGGIPEIITSDRYGLLVDPADPDDLKQKILTGLERTWDRQAIYAYARQFTWETIAKKIQGVYNQVELP